MKIACGCYHSVILSDNYEVFTFGRGNHGQLGHGNIFESHLPKQVAGLKNKKAIKIAAGFYHTVVLVDQSSTKIPGSLSSAMEKLFKNPSRADVKFSIEGKSIHCNRCIIYARSRELDDAITREGISTVLSNKECGDESKIIEMIINEVSFESMERFINFLYTDNLDDKSQAKFLSTKQLIEIMYLAEKYKVEKLRRIADYYAKKSFSVDSITLALKTACELQITTFKAQCIEYIMKHFGEVIGTQAFSELPSEILKEVLSSASKIGVSVQDNQRT